MPKRGGSRGRAKPSLRDLSDTFPTVDEFAATLLSLDSMNARASALVLSSLVEAHLQLAIRSTFLPMEPKNITQLFRDPNSPIGSFSAKIAIAHALGIFDDQVRKQFDILRVVRNAFAHTMLDIDFTHPQIASECLKLDMSKIVEHVGEVSYANLVDPRERFTTFGMFAGMFLQDYLSTPRAARSNLSQITPTPFRGEYGKPPPRS